VGGCLVERALADRRLAHTIALRTTLLTYNDCVASHESSALVMDLPLLNVPPYAIVTRERGAWRGGSVSRVRIAPLPAHHLEVSGDTPHTSLPRTVVDIARSASLREAAVVGDAAVRNRCGISELRVALDECANWADVGKARTALAFFDGRSESALESVSRVIMHERELPAPELQAEFTATESTYRTDFYWKAQGVIGEADGMQKYETRDVLRGEKVRQERLERMGLRVVRWNWREMLVDTDETIARIRCALR
jgi:very-short-patch-repair endonuclease